MKPATKIEIKPTEKGKFLEQPHGQDVWREVILEDVASEITVGHVGPMASEYVEAGIPFLRSQNVQYLRIETEDIKFITPAFHKLLRKSSLSPGDVVIVRTGKPGTCAVIPDWLPVANCSDLVIVRCSSELDPHFLAYFVNSLASGHVAAHLVGAVQQHFNVESARKIRLNLPPTYEQRAVARFLRALDGKIELNHLMNRTLEAMGRAIFKHWFTEFEFPNADGQPYRSSSGKMVYNEGLGREIPKDWRASRLGREVQIELGGTPDRTRAEFWNGDINWINSGKVNEFRIVEPSAMITREGLDSSATKLLVKGTVVLAITGATLGQVSRLEIDSCANQSVIGIVENERMSSEYLYFWIKETINDLVGWQTGGAQQHINKGNVENSIVLVPSERIMQEYTGIARPIFERISSLCVESLNLARIRDLLLPKLISGKLRVPAEVR